jgi:putative transposase
MDNTGARNFLMDLGHRATPVKFLIRDRAGQFTGSFDAVFTAEGIRIPASPSQAPRANAICERIIGTLRWELLDRLLIVNEHHLRHVLTGYLQHCNTGRPHRALGQLTPAQADACPPADHLIRRKQVLGGLTHEYYAAALPTCAATKKQVTLRTVFPSPTGCRCPCGQPLVPTGLQNPAWIFSNHMVLP